MISKNIGLELPDYLDAEEFDLVWADVRQRIGFNEGAFRLFHMAWHGVANRALAVDHYLAQARLLPPYGYKSTHANNLEHDMVLVAFLQSICSAVDCLAFAAFALAATANPEEFPITKADHLRSATRASVAARFVKVWPSELLTSLVGGLANDSCLRFIFDVRDVVTHRGVVPRTLYVGGDRAGNVTIPTEPKSLPDAWTSDLDLSVPTLQRWRSDLAGHLGPASLAVLHFIQKFGHPEGPVQPAPV